MPGRLGARVLGEFALDGADLAGLKSRKARRVLKVLALARGATVSTDRLIEAVWPDGLPADPDRDIAVLVSRIRSVVGTERVVRRGLAVPGRRSRPRRAGRSGPPHRRCPAGWIYVGQGRGRTPFNIVLELRQ